MKEIVLGTAGHVDHGKTSFVKALTHIDTDRLKEEKKRGITIELGFAFLDLPCGHRLGIVDVPGHERFVKNMVAGVTGIDLVAFIVAADEGIMPQTREHFEICSLLGVAQGMIVITKKDLVDEEWLEMVCDEVREFCAGSFLEDAPLVAVSSVTGEGMDEVRQTLDTLVKGLRFQEVFGPFRLPIDRIFAMKGFGTVITGTSISGRTGIAQELQLYPSEKIAKIRGIQVHSAAVEEVEAGHRTAINLQGVEVSDMVRGMVAATPGSCQSGFMLDCRLAYLHSALKPLKHRARVRVHLGTAEIMGRVSLLTCDELEPGAQAWVQLLLEEPVAVWRHDRFVIRSYSPVITIGGGEILGNVAPRKRKRATEKDRAENKRVFEILQDGSQEELLLTLLEEYGQRGLTFDEVALRLGLFAKQLKKVLNEPLSAKKIVVVDSASQRYLTCLVAERISMQLLQLLSSYHALKPLQEGLQKEELRTRMKVPLDQKVFGYCLGELIKRGEVVQDGSLVRLSSHQVALQADEKEIETALLSWYGEKALAPATLKETLENFSTYPEKMVRDVCALLLRDGRLVKVSESLYYQCSALDALQEQLVSFMQREGDIDAQRFKEMTGLSRKYSIPLLEYFDRIRLTYRVDDRRLLR